ncbi:MAG: 50S ribosomal protein L25 [Spirochaetaceae bacterium]|nr:MAG: 50S ribosomal protein L25 [Spirochaetaceae bacterium]
MDQKTLETSIRTERKSSNARRLRKAGKIPGIIYGHHEPVAITIDAVEFGRKFRHISESTIITLNTGEQSYDVLIKDYQEDILTGKMLHIDFYEIELGKAVRTHIPVHITGSAKGTREGGILEHPLYEVEIECLPKDLVEAISVDVSGLAIGDSIHISDVVPPEGITILNSGDQIVAVCSVPAAEVAEDEESEEDVDAEVPSAHGSKKEEDEE